MIIDDEFDKIVRQMFERFFGGPMEMGPEGSATFTFRMMTTGMGPEQNEIPQTTGRTRDVEQIELEDRMIMIIDGVNTDIEPAVSMRDGQLVIKFTDGENNTMKFDIPFNVDIEKSRVSLRNGVLEIDLVKDADDKSGKNEGALQYE
ncbi:MAG: Hsp20/alpha crystallin family protein [Candidatus Thorarchaeota archaeon]